MFCFNWQQSYIMKVYVQILFKNRLFNGIYCFLIDLNKGTAEQASPNIMLFAKGINF